MSKRGKHKSLTSDLDRSIRWLESLPAVTKVVLGRTENCRHSYPPGFIRHQRDVPGGFYIKGYSGNGIVDIYVGVEHTAVETIKELIKSKFKLTNSS